MIRTGWFLLGACVALAGTCSGQKALNWRVFKATDGLTEPSCASVTFSPRGKVLVKSFYADSASGLDGYTIQNFPGAGGGHGRVYESAGGQLWTTYDDGLQEFRDDSWHHYPVRQVAAEFHGNARRLGHAISLCPVKQGRVLILLPGELLEFSIELQETPQITQLRSAAQTSLEKFSGMVVAPDGGLWITGMRGVALLPGPARALKPETDWRQFLPPGALQIQNLQEPQEDDEGLTAIAEAAADHHKVIVHFDGQHWEISPYGNDRLRAAWRGPDKRIWATTGDLLYQKAEGRPDFLECEDISPRQYNDVAVEPGGAFWLATSDGLYRCAPCLWQSPNFFPKVSSPAHCAMEDQDGRLWFASNDGLHMIQNDQAEEYPFPASSTLDLRAVHALYPLPNGALAMDTGGSLLQFQPGKNQFGLLPAEPRQRQLRALGLFKDGTLCVQVVGRDAPGESVQLASHDGTVLKAPPSTQPGPTVTGDISAFLATQNGNVWLSTGQGVSWFHDEKWQTFTATDGTVPQGVGCFLELPDGKIWCATQDRVWEFGGRTWTVVRTGFDRINCLLRSRDGSIWVATNNGLHRYFENAWVENGIEDGLPNPAVRQVLEDRRGRIWTCTSRGVSLYHPEADSDPPLTSIQILPEREKNNIPEGTDVTLVFGGMDKWRYTSSDRLLYSYRLDGMDWAPFQERNNISFADLPAGKHYFQVRAMDRNCNIDPKPARLEFAIALPWYREARLLWISVAGFCVAVFFAGLAFNRHRQLVRSYAEVEKKVAERTRQLDAANRELFHSQKMNALGTLAAGIAHDFNNILSIVKGSAQIIEDNVDNPQKIHTRVDRIKTVVEQGAGIVKAMLGFSRTSGEAPASCDLNAVVGETVKLLGDRFLRDVDVHFEPAPHLPQYPALPDFIQQILLNFIFNAAEAMTERRQVVLRTGRAQQLPDGMALVPEPATDYVYISVADLGCGILPENLPRIFEPFFTTKAMSARRGTGLGLSMVYELAKKIGAGLAVDSIVNQGSTFTLFLPVRVLPADAKSDIREEKIMR